VKNGKGTSLLVPQAVESTLALQRLRFAFIAWNEFFRSLFSRADRLRKMRASALDVTLKKANASAITADERALDVTFSEDALSASLRDGRVISVPLVWYPRLLNATPAQRKLRRFAGVSEAGARSRNPERPLRRNSRAIAKRKEPD